MDRSCYFHQPDPCPEPGVRGSDLTMRQVAEAPSDAPLLGSIEPPAQAFADATGFPT